MSEFKTDFSIELSSRWVRSVESETIDGLEDLGDDASESMDAVWFSRELEPHLQVGASFDRHADQWPYLVGDIMKRPYYEQGTPDEQRRIRAALTGEPRWVYTSEHMTDGLWDETVPTRTAPLNKMSRLVLSGALGDALLEDYSGLGRQAESFTEGRLNTAILIGAAATYMYQRLYHRTSEQGTYRALDQSGLLEWETQTGGDIHGDFRTSRSARPVQAITDTVNAGFEHHFMPAIQEASVGAYHSTEPGIVSGLLYYLVVHKDTDRAALHQRLVEKLSKQNVAYGGAFADYGDSDGESTAMALAYRLERAAQTPSKKETVLYQSIVVPDPTAALRFSLQGREEGVAFVISEGARSASEMMVPVGEIEEYIITLIAGGGGRTAPGAMLRSIDALVNEP